MHRSEAELRLKVEKLIKLNEEHMSGVSLYTESLLSMIAQQDQVIAIQKKVIESLIKNKPDKNSN